MGAFWAFVVFLIVVVLALLESKIVQATIGIIVVMLVAKWIFTP